MKTIKISPSKKGNKYIISFYNNDTLVSFVYLPITSETANAFLGEYTLKEEELSFDEKKIKLLLDYEKENPDSINTVQNEEILVISIPYKVYLNNYILPLHVLEAYKELSFSFVKDKYFKHYNTESNFYKGNKVVKYYYNIDNKFDINR